MSASLFSKPSERTHSGMDMLLCPPQSHTSPTSTSFSVMPAPPELLTVSSRPSKLACKGSSCTVQDRSVPAVAVLVWPAKLTVTCCPVSAQPQTLTGLPRWRTMWWLKIRARPSPGGMPAGAGGGSAA